LFLYRIGDVLINVGKIRGEYGENAHIDYGKAFKIRFRNLDKINSM